MALKDNLQSIKSEINSEEQFLENMIKGERFFHKYFKSIIIILVVALSAFVIYKFVEYKKESDIISANEAYNRLFQNKEQKGDKELLKEKAPSLYAMYILSDTNSSSNLEELKNLKCVDPFLIDLAKFKTNKNNDTLLVNYAALLKGFEFIKNGDFGKADIEFSKIPMDSNLQKIIKNLKHYNGTRK
ncbi:hypothetical protein CSPB12327_03340 [Campylobacter sp. RM12327]|uniref:hypothetical protein n=1 Tax=Campylobacter sputorum TaxID=206 RepID=UPI000B76F0E6|nr:MULTISPECIES: hypothetical protein [Campylobacter]ASM39871.1 hypothetical protein CSPB_0637 [Campylobacter sputorum]MBE7357521.1 hypothetical protein [Campylobacter sp. RM11302]MBF6669179.1 hypothetical protein [Campylobacter sp. RM12327]MBF6674346.1 hypothetical protein [Campylobacter sp. RM13538]MBF6675387.1 hypothetical protein [Campylobacter sp. RM12321]